MFSLGHKLIGDNGPRHICHARSFVKPQRVFVNQITFKTTLLCLLIPFRESEAFQEHVRTYLHGQTRRT